MPQSNTITIDSNKTLQTFNLKNQKLSGAKPEKLPPKKVNKNLKQLLKTSSSKTSTSKKTEPSLKEKLEKEELSRVIIKYETNERFGAIIKKELGFKHTETQLSKKSKDELEVMLQRIRTHLNTRNLDQMFNHMVKQTAKGYEELVTGFGYDIRGFEQLLMNNPAFWDAFERWKIEHKMPDVPPSLQLMYIVASTTYVAHAKNLNVTIPSKPKLKTKRSDIEIIDQK